jgi:hypothetical protein
MNGALHMPKRFLNPATKGSQFCADISKKNKKQKQELSEVH